MLISISTEGFLDCEATCNSPLTAALSVLAGTREPNGVVGHFGGGVRRLS